MDECCIFPYRTHIGSHHRLIINHIMMIIYVVSYCSYPCSKTRAFKPLEAQCWASVADGRPALSQHWLKMSCMLGFITLRTSSTLILQPGILCDQVISKVDIAVALHTSTCSSGIKMRGCLKFYLVIFKLTNLTSTHSIFVQFTAQSEKWKSRVY